MANLDNTNRDLTEGLVRLLRSEVSGWSTNDDYNVDNVWTRGVPDSVDEEFPRGVVDIIGGSDFDLSVELDVKLREVVVKVVVFSKTAAEAEDLIEESEQAIADHWENYTADWSFRQTDGFTELTENENTEGDLRYNRSVDFVFETVKENN